MTDAITATLATGNYQSPSRRLSRESLGDWVKKDPLARNALAYGFTEAELIHALLKEKEQLLEQLTESIKNQPPPIIIYKSSD